MIRDIEVTSFAIEQAIRDAEAGRSVDSRMVLPIIEWMRDDAAEDLHAACEDSAAVAYAEGQHENAWAVERVEELERELEDAAAEHDTLEDELFDLRDEAETLRQRIAALEQDVIDSETALAEAEEKLREVGA